MHNRMTEGEFGEYLYIELALIKEQELCKCSDIFY